MNTSEKGRALHSQEEIAREKGEFTEALKFSDEAMVAYQEDGDKLGFAEILAARFLILRHLYEKTNDKIYLILGKYSAMASVEIAEQSGDRTAMALPLFNLAKVQEELEDFSTAVATYKKAVEAIVNFPPLQNNRPGVVADFENHLAVCEYKAGDETALNRAEVAIARLAETDEQKYNKDVWMSGGHMRIAAAVASKDQEKAKQHLKEAEAIAEANPELKLRREQIGKLRKKLGL